MSTCFFFFFFFFLQNGCIGVLKDSIDMIQVLDKTRDKFY